MNAFATALASLSADPNLGMDIIYRPAAGVPVACRARLAEPDLEAQIASVRLRQHKRVLLVEAANLAQPAKGDLVEAPAGTAALRVMDFRAADAQRLDWKIELAEQ